MRQLYTALRAIVLVLGALLLGASLWAQQRVTGTVTDGETGEALVGATIRVPNTTIGTLTDLDGEFALTVPEGTTNLLVSYLGYADQRIAVGNGEGLSIAMGLDELTTGEVVVVGYGTRKKSDLTGVVTAVSEDEFNQGVIVSPDQLLTGKVAGVQITQNSGEPGGQVQIRVRGGTSINAGNEPLYVVDGVPIDVGTNNPGGFGSGRNPLNFLNPNDIESMTVLKDASAAAIYGSRGANGVIIITTKKGKAGTGRVSYDGWASWATPNRQVDLLSADQFLQVARNELSPAERARITDTTGATSTDWQDRIFDTGFGQSHQVSFTGGAGGLGYRASLGYLNQEGILLGSSTERVSLNLNLNHRLFDDALKIDVNLKTARTEDQFAPQGAIGAAIQFDPTAPVLDPESPWGGYFEFENNIATKNPVSELEQTLDEGENYRALGNIQLEYFLPFVEGLSAKVNLAFDANTGLRRRFLPSTLRSQFTDSGEVRTANYTRLSPLFEGYLNYNRTFNDVHALSLTGGYSYQDFNNTFPETRSWMLANNLFGFNSTLVAGMSQANIFIEENRLISFFGRVNYDFDNKYLFTATVRRDGSSRFGPENQWGVFPSAAFGWQILQEDFADGLKGVFESLKLRASWGVTGNQEFGNYLYLPRFRFSDPLSLYQFGSDFVSTARPNGYNPFLKWEETEQWNFGLDYSIANGRLSGSLEYYIKNTSDLLFEVNVPAGANLTNRIIQNIGTLQNSGVEFALDAYVIDTRDLRWDLNFNASTNMNEITQLTGQEDTAFIGILTGGISGGVGNNVQIQSVGSAVNSFYVYEHKLDGNGLPLIDGVDHNEDGVINLADMYEDQNGDEMVNDLDRRIFNNPAPRFLFGLTSNIDYKGFGLFFTLRANVGNYVYNNLWSNTGNYTQIQDPINPRNMSTNVLTTNFTRPQYFSDYYVQNASFLRMDNVTLSYNFEPREGSESTFRARVYTTVQNAFVLTSYEGLDPEIPNGIDNNIYPRARTFLVGLSLSL